MTTPGQLFTSPLLVGVTLLVVHATLLLTGSLAIGRVAWRTDPGSRHAWWVSTLAGLLLLPLLLIVMPSTIPGRWDPESLRPAAPASVLQSVPQATGVTALQPTTPADRSVTGWALIALGAVYAMGVLANLGTFGLSLRRRRDLRRGATPLTTPEWVQPLHALQAELGIGRVVDLRHANAAIMPATWGWRSPVIVLPPDATCWPQEHCRAVLHHELGHIARGDATLLHIGRLACAVYWFHPLAWKMLRHLIEDQELATDELVLRTGAEPRRYAAALLEIAKAHTGHKAMLSRAPAFAGPVPLQRRLQAILALSMTRPGRPRTQRGSAVMLATVVVLAVSTLTPAASEEASARRGASTQVVQTGIRIEWPTRGGTISVAIPDGVAWSEKLADIRVPVAASVRIVERGEGNFSRELTISADATVEARIGYFENGQERTIDAAAEQWLAPILRDVTTELALLGERRAFNQARQKAFVPGVGTAPDPALITAIERKRNALHLEHASLVARGAPPRERFALERLLLALDWEELRLVQPATQSSQEPAR